MMTKRRVVGLGAVTAGARIATLFAAAGMAACATTDRPAPVTRRAETPANTSANAPVEAPKGTAPNAVLTPASPPTPVFVRRPGPAADTFIGGPVEALERLIGEPALVRREGQAEFRRYDVTDYCRAFAVISDGRVASLTTGGAVQGAVAPAFEDCTAVVGTVGS